MKLTKKEIFSIPNIMGYFRILLIPLFVYFYCTADGMKDYLIAGAVILLSGITDLFDGKIARIFNMVTELGKALDPVADKLTLCAIAFCVMFKVEIFRIVFIVMLMKELFLLAANLISMKRVGRKLDGAMWFGKICTATLYAGMILMLFFPGMPAIWQTVIAALCCAVIIGSFAMYIPVFIKMNRREELR